MKTGREYIRYSSDGCAARQPEVIRFTVYEGGLSALDSDGASSVQKPQSKSQKVVHTQLAIRMASIIAVILIAAVMFIDSTAAWQRSTGFDSIQTTEIYVQPGESLWSIAASHGVEGHSTKDVASYISNKNNLSDSMLTIGQKLTVPLVQ